MVGTVVLLAVAGLVVAMWGLSKLSKHLESRKVSPWLFFPVMTFLLLLAGVAFLAAIQYANTFQGV